MRRGEQWHVLTKLEEAEKVIQGIRELMERIPYSQEAEAIADLLAGYKNRERFK